MNVPCKRNVICLVFIIFGIFNISCAYFLYGKTDNIRPLIASCILYTVLFTTIGRYHEYVTFRDRIFSVVLILICYVGYWSYLCWSEVTFNQETKPIAKDEILYFMLFCSVVTAICDVGVFTPCAYRDNGVEYDPIPVID
jgi:hypothetical protein